MITLEKLLTELKPESLNEIIAGNCGCGCGGGKSHKSKKAKQPKHKSSSSKSGSNNNCPPETHGHCI